jgi:hypothetical protein
MKLFERTGGHYLFWTGAIYFTLGMYCIFVDSIVPVWMAQAWWIAILCLPFVIPPLGRWLNMNITWDKNMFEMFNKKSSNVVEFPEQKNQYKAPPGYYGAYAEPSKKEEPVTTYYRLGITSNGRVSFQMGHSEITMSTGGIDNLIAQLEVFRDQIAQYEDNGPEDDPDGGEPVPVPVPVPERKAA